MPELPEVETTLRFLEPHLLSRRLLEVELRHPRTGRRNENPADVVDRLQGRTVQSLGRQGKFILGELDSGLTLVIHLGMSGRILISAHGEPEPLHTHFVARTDLEEEIRFIDPRTFGFVAVFTPEELESELKLGRDAYRDLPRTPQLGEKLKGRKAAIKNLLLNQGIVAGLGNIYADEVLFRARVRPTRPGGDLGKEELTRLRAAITPVLKEGIAAGGTSLADLAYLLPDGRAGQFRERLNVYGRAGEPCYRCGTVIERIVLQNRSAFFCPSCQK